MKQECIRVEEFRQLKKEIRGSKDYLIVGIDVAKNKHRAFLGTATGRTVLRWLVVENSESGFEHLLAHVQFYMGRDGFSRVVFGLEPTSVYHKPLAEFLIRNDFMVVYTTKVRIWGQIFNLDKWPVMVGELHCQNCFCPSSFQRNMQEIECEIRNALVVTKRFVKIKDLTPIFCIHQQKAAAQLGALIEYAKTLKTSHQQIKAETAQLLKSHRKHGVLSEKGT